MPEFEFEDDTKIGHCIFTIADVKLYLKSQLQRDPTASELKEALDKVIESHLESAMCIAGWEYIESVL